MVPASALKTPSGRFSSRYRVDISFGVFAATVPRWRGRGERIASSRSAHALTQTLANIPRLPTLCRLAAKMSGLPPEGRFVNIPEEILITGGELLTFMI